MSAVEEIAAYLTLVKYGGKTFDQAIYDEFIEEGEMSATEELRRLLDERGVDVHDGGHDYTVVRLSDGREFSYYEYEDAEYDERIRICSNLLTVEQAVEATLGRGTCRRALDFDGTRWVCSECSEHFGSRRWHYCPNCGRKVVDE